MLSRVPIFQGVQPRRGHGRNGFHPVESQRDPLQQHDDLLQRARGGATVRGEEILLRVLGVHLPGAHSGQGERRWIEGVRRVASEAAGQQGEGKFSF